MCFRGILLEASGEPPRWGREERIGWAAPAYAQVRNNKGVTGQWGVHFRNISKAGSVKSVANVRLGREALIKGEGKIKSFYASNDTIKQVKRPTTNEKIFANYISDKALVFRVRKELLHPQKKRHRTRFQHEQRIWIDMSPRRIHMWPLST